MLTCKKTYNIVALKKDWILLQEKGGLHTPFQDYDYMRRTWMLFWPYCFTKKYIVRFYSFYDDSECVMIVPVAHYLGMRCAELLGNVNGFNYCDVLVADEKYIKPALAMMVRDYDTLICNKVLERSLLYKAIKDSLAEDNASPCVYIDFDTYEDYYSSLSKNMRKNLKNAYNRVKTDGISIDLRVYKGGEKHSFDYKPFLEMYCDRKHKKYNVNNSFLRKWFLLHYNFATRNYVKNSNGITFALFFNERLAAFMSGVKGSYNDFVLPRIGMEEDFYFYSPAILLLNESIKYFIEETDIRILDLSHGEEEYKYRMGGKPHLTHNFRCDLLKL